jgi:GT2 family glycosyltransferase
MEVTIGVPTYRNDGTTIEGFLEALTRQSFRRFRVLLVYKPSEGDRTEEVISRFKDKLDLEIIYQDKGYFEEAMNMLFSRADSDLLLLTDDDTVPSSNWVEDHVKSHQVSERGIVGNNKTVRKIRFGLAERIYSKIFEKPIDPRMSEYVVIIAETGLWTYNKNVMKSGNVVKTLGLSGYNMSVKREVYKDFRLEEMTFRGAYNENYLGVHALRKGFHSVFIENCCETVHLERESISRSKDLNVIKQLYAESVLSAYYFSKFYKVNLKKLFFDMKIKTMKWNMKDKRPESLAAVEGLRIGLRIALEAIKGGYEARRVREMLRKSLKISM